MKYAEADKTAGVDTELAKTNYAAQIEQMKKADLSPALMYGQAGAGGGTVSGAQGQGTS